MHSSDTVVTPTWSNSSNPLARGVAQPLQRFLHREIAATVRQTEIQFPQLREEVK